MCGVHPNNCLTAEDYQKDKVYLPIGGKVYRIDSCIHQIVAALNAGGVPTENCCCGHGKEPATILLTGGQCIVIYKSLNEYEGGK
jgi:choline kinase